MLFSCKATPVVQENINAIQKQAIVLIQSGRFNDASNLLLQTVGRYPNEVTFWNLLGIAETEAGELAPAKRAFERGLELAPQSADLNENLGLLFFRNAEYVKAKIYLSIAVKLGSDKPGVRFSLAASNLRTGDPAKALQELKSLEAELSGSSDYWEERGRAELLSDAPSAQTSFDRALALAPDNVAALNDAATAAEKQGVDEKALAYLIRARTLAPNDPVTLTHFGAVCIRRDLGLDAQDALSRAYQLQPSNNAALYLLARAKISLQNWQQAYDLFEQLSHRASQFAPAYYAMGWLDIRLNRLEDARVQLKHALALDPSLGGAAYELAQLEFDDGQLDSAEKLLRTALAVHAGDAKANVLLGDILMRKGKLDEAETLLTAAVEHDPSLAAAHYKLSILFLRKHEPEQAEKEKSIASNLTNAAMQASKTQLKLVLPETESVH
ncbi:MAG TPA: tetratricopeptide repeat protein [Bryobacteraceae bacterium]|nr:tetratricopeptide repeat protein [Bryobacteraceae bacterium]